nr:CPARA_3gp383 [Cryptomonas curvata]
MNIIKILSIPEFKIIFKIDKFFNKNLKNIILIFGKNNSKKKIIVSYLIHYYTRIIRKEFPTKKEFHMFDKINQEKNADSFSKIEYVKILYPKTKVVEVKFLKFLDSELSNLYKFKKNKKIIILYQISFLSKMGNKKLYNIIKKHLDNFFFIFTADSLSKLSITLKDKIFCFPVSGWNNFFKQKKIKINYNNKEIVQFNSVLTNRFLGPLIKQKQIFKILFWFQFKTFNKYNISKNEKLEITIEHCLENFLLRKLIDLINSYYTNFSLFKLELSLKWNKTKYLIAHIFYKLLQVNI